MFVVLAWFLSVWAAGFGCGRYIFPHLKGRPCSILVTVTTRCPKNFEAVTTIVGDQIIVTIIPKKNENP